MSGFNVPAAGIPIQHTPINAKKPPQIVQLKLSSKETDSLLKHIRDGGEARLRTGRGLAVNFGTKHVVLHQVTDKYPQEMFSGPLDGSKPAYFSGKLSHVLEQKQAREAIAGTDKALEKLKSTLRQAGEERNPAEITNKLLKPGQHRHSPLVGGLMSSRPSSPFLSGLSPRAGPTSAPLQSGQSNEEKIRLAAIKIPVIHLLASEPHEPKQLVAKLRVKRADLDLVLMKVAQDVDGGKKKLRDRAFRDLDVWKFPYQSQSDRQKAIDHAISAFDRQRIGKSDNVWQMLLAKEDRGKDINLSRLNFDKPLTTGNLTPKVPERSTDGGSTEGKSMKSATSGESAQKGKVPVSKLTDSHPKTKPTAEKIAKSLKNSGERIPTPKPASKVKEVGGKQDVKHKSSERIEDSDEEASAAPSLPAVTTNKRNESRPKAPNTERSSNSIAKSIVHKPHLSGSSGGSSDPDRGRLTPNSAMVKTRGGKDTTRGPEGVKDTSATQIDSSLSRNISRQRNGSSPAKPSPLGSSPPANSRDVDSSSNSSKSTALSSAPSSPPSTSDSSQIKKSFSPNVEPRKPEKQANGIKRKADASHNGAPAKKQHLTNGRNDHDKFNSLPKPLADEINRQPPSKGGSPDSDTSSGTEKTFTKSGLIEEARKFHKYYANYKDIHEKLNKVEPSKRDDDELDKLWKMHVRLKEMKEQIWREWDRLEKPVKA